MKKLVLVLALLTTQLAFGAFSTCRSLPDISTPVSLCGPPGAPYSSCPSSRCGGTTVSAGSACSFSLNPCAGCNTGLPYIVPVWSYSGACYPSGLACNCSPRFTPLGTTSIASSCSNYNACCP